MKSRKREIPIVTQSGRFTDAYNSSVKKKEVFLPGKESKTFPLCL